jgi:hypothetical protein
MTAEMTETCYRENSINLLNLYMNYVNRAYNR